MSRLTIFLALALVLMVTLPLAVQSLDIIKGIGDTVTCPGKIKDDCGDIEISEDKNEKRAYCCGWARATRCYEMSAERHCPGSPVSGLMKINVDTGYCEGYTFWAPECLYTNYLLAVIGSTIGVVCLAIGACLLCYCCCCRRK